MGLTQSSVLQIIYRDLDFKCIFSLPRRLLPIIISFSYSYISQGSVATVLMRGGIFNRPNLLFIANCPLSVPVEEV